MRLLLGECASHWKNPASAGRVCVIQRFTALGNIQKPLPKCYECVSIRRRWGGFFCNAPGYRKHCVEKNGRFNGQQPGPTACVHVARRRRRAAAVGEDAPLVLLRAHAVDPAGPSRQGAPEKKLFGRFREVVRGCSCLQVPPTPHRESGHLAREHDAAGRGDFRVACPKGRHLNRRSISGGTASTRSLFS